LKKALQQSCAASSAQRLAVPQIFDGEKEAKLIALACSKPPKGRARWTLRLLEKKVVELDIVDLPAHSAINRVFKKHSQTPSPAAWVSPKTNTAFIAAKAAHVPAAAILICPLVCLDRATMVIASSPVPIDETGASARSTLRSATHHLTCSCCSLEGWRHVKVTDRHTAVDYAHVLKDLADIHFPRAKTILLVQDNLNIHSKASLYEAFPAAQARRLVERFEWHYTPKHGSWLDLAESELGVLSSQCLDRRIPDKQTLSAEIAAWQQDPYCHTQIRLALHHQRRPYQTQTPISFNLNESGD
jgi:hypothetical protein